MVKFFEEKTPIFSPNFSSKIFLKIITLVPDVNNMKIICDDIYISATQSSSTVICKHKICMASYIKCAT
jgi:hypothetical protein